MHAWCVMCPREYDKFVSETSSPGFTTAYPGVAALDRVALMDTPCFLCPVRYENIVGACLEALAIPA